MGMYRIRRLEGCRRGDRFGVYERVGEREKAPCGAS
jgi:hypothetical protein